MKRIFVGLVILLTQFILSLPWDSLYWDILPSIQEPYSILFAIITSIILVIWFLNLSQLHYRLYGSYLKESQTNVPIPGLWLISIGAIIYLLYWPPVAILLLAITSGVPADSVIMVVLTFSLVFGYISKIVMSIAVALILWGTIRMFAHLTPKE